MSLVITPRMSEKAYAVATERNTYVFVVPISANKVDIKKAIEAHYEVTVKTVNVVVQDGKVKQSYKKRGGRTIGKRSDFKKAYVRVAEGQTIPVFAAIDAEEEKK